MKSNEDTEGLFCLSVQDFSAGRGWEESARAQQRARWACEQLEEGRILFFDHPPFALADEDRRFLTSQKLGDSRFHKNISYRPAQDLLRGFASPDPEDNKRMHEFMRRYSQEVTSFLKILLAPYAPHWELDYASFRPEAEQGRKLPVRKRNDLLHVDAFPSRPTRGGRILRCFTNINPTQPRIWQTTDGFAVLAQKYAQEAGLARMSGTPALAGFTQVLKKTLGLTTKTQSPYDRFMLRFHDYLKENTTFQQECRKIRLEFPPGSTWLCFTDSVPHAVSYGQYALEQTFIVPLTAMVTPEKSPLRVLEALAGKPLVSTAAAGSERLVSTPS